VHKNHARAEAKTDRDQWGGDFEKKKKIKAPPQRGKKSSLHKNWKKREPRKQLAGGELIDFEKKKD